ncbi:DUF2145 domain-containing protein [Comamonas testosteroni]|jgi:hypothetical protein|uniref:DUF2145 domain-containing protein n=1 Tax=Comamonas testosteroni (strain DSM 14576 / KF-1) TaxID=399795 RepID=B7WY67_COMTK|nr:MULTISPECIES: DUF2145 domain-containing protein [Comamonas]EED69765.1 conserved hypothetical protein [Comamonas testosteroni KF-1]TYK71775.1 DUF2145 domain-containing protein [Comamonas sp. Z3]WQG67715.1 DUF2145 domain-containing protein [Comamonas testosteroni]
MIKEPTSVVQAMAPAQRAGMPIRGPVVLALGAALIAWAGSAQAGRSCEDRPLTADVMAKGLNLAARTAKALDAEFQKNGTQVVLLARQGQDLSKYDLKYSHYGWAYRTPAGPWRVAHKLNECGTASGHIYRQGLGEFFLDDMWRYEAAIQIPTPAVQQALLKFLSAPTVLRLQNEPYSMVSYVWSSKYQQSNQWATETLAAAMEPAAIQNRAQAQAWLQAKGYEPSALIIRAFSRLGGRMTAANIAFDDHPNEKRFASRIETVTVDSVTQWLQRTQLASAVRTVQ